MDIVNNEKEDPDAEATVVPLPAVDTTRDHERVRSSNDRDQRLERDGHVASHNQGYDEVADLTPPAPAESADE